MTDYVLGEMYRDIDSRFGTLTMCGIFGGWATFITIKHYDGRETSFCNISNMAAIYCVIVISTIPRDCHLPSRPAYCTSLGGWK